MDAINKTVQERGYGFLTTEQKALYNQSQNKPAPVNAPQPAPVNANVISASSLKPVTPIEVATVPPMPEVQVPPPPVVPEAPQVAPLTPWEQRMQSEFEKATSANEALAGRAAYAAEQQNLAGVGEQSKLQKELTAQLVAIGNEARAIPLKMQEQAFGRGVTKGGLAPIEAGQSRQNAIKALELNSQLSAVQGNLQNAMDMADRAVESKYGPIEAQLKTSLANLDLISKNPQYTAEQKAKAEKTAAEQQAKLDAIATEKENAKAVNDELVRAISYNPGIDQMSIRALSAAKSPAEFAMIANYLGLETMSPQDKADLEYKQAQIAGLRGKTAAKTGTGGVSYDTDGNVVGGAVADTVSAASSPAQAWLAQFNSGLMTADEIYTKMGSSKEATPLKNELARLIAAQGGKRIYGQDDATIQAINSQIKNIDDLLYKRDKEGNIIKGSTGEYGKIVGLVQGGAGVLPDRWNVGKQDVLAIAKNLSSNQTLTALAEAKSKGITFGALSEGELALVSDAASRIAAKLQQKKDKNGNIVVTGFSGSEKQFKDDLLEIKKGLEKAVAIKTQTTTTPTQTNASDEALLSQFGL